MSHPRPCCGTWCYCDGEDGQSSTQCSARCDCDVLEVDVCEQCRGSGRYTYTGGINLACDNCGGSGYEP